MEVSLYYDIVHGNDTVHDIVIIIVVIITIILSKALMFSLAFVVNAKGGSPSPASFIF